MLEVAAFLHLAFTWLMGHEKDRNSGSLLCCAGWRGCFEATAARDWAYGKCSTIQSGGVCYEKSTIVDHASYAFTLYCLSISAATLALIPVVVVG
ncbi:hypothetical protein KP509_11G082700 [Ceratopteris richardii]|uniref:Secreted protein n=1 Tax=Ceratopteris richardii TaxID=49495 RepID=A0A8T2TUG4_CERRI|nr:hypothetical protein KP509_11G082700 [Ceratopteris richardii]